MLDPLPFALTLSVCAVLAAQDPPAPIPAALPTVPIHGKPDDPGYGRWAMGQGYKASFHDGFAFHPLLGSAYAEGLPLRWQTESVSIGAHELVQGPAAAVQAQPSPWRFEYRHGSFSECYDVRGEGVEQSFVVHEGPASAGALVIRGRVRSALTAPPRPAEHAPLVFHGPAGEELVTYGAAIAFDAAGRRTAVSTAYADGFVTLTVPSGWLAAATYPVTVDPLLSMVSRAMPGAVQSVDVAEDSISTSSLLVAVTYATSATDHDVVAFLADSDFSPAATVFTDLGGADSDSACAAYVGGAQRWVIALRRNGWTYAYPLVRNDLTLNGSGAPLQVTAGRPVIGGTRDGQTAAIVVTTTAAPAPQVMVVIWNPTTRQTENWMDAHPPATNADIERVHPAINQVAKADAWLVVWEEIDRVHLTTSIRGNIVRRNDTVGTVRNLTFSPAGAPAHRMRPAVAGMEGRYLVACVAGTTANVAFGQQVHTRRVDWADASSSGTLGTARVLLAYGNTGSAGELDLAYDDETRSHWGLGYRSGSLLGSSVRLVRLGYSGGSVESIALPTQPVSVDQWSPRVTFDRGGNAFSLGFAADTAGNPVWLGRLGYSPAATTFTYGVSCGGTISSSPAPYAGHQFFRLLLGGAAGSPASALLIHGAQHAIALDPLGMPGCRLYVHPEGMVSIPAAVIGTGSLLELPLPDAPVFLGDLFCQWLVVAPGANALGLTTTQGHLVHVR